jgi:2-isopropylmalate synthase
VTFDDSRQRLYGNGNGPIAAAVDALGIPVRIDNYEERAISAGAEAQAVAILEAAWPGMAGSTFGAGLSTNIVTASVVALVNAVNRLAARGCSVTLAAERASAN